MFLLFIYLLFFLNYYYYYYYFNFIIIIIIYFFWGWGAVNVFAVTVAVHIFFPSLVIYYSLLLIFLQ